MHKTVSMRIRSARQAARLTQAALADRLEVSRSAVAQWENAAGSTPSTASFAKLAGALECSFEWLATGRGPRSRSPDRAHDPEALAAQVVVVRHFARDDDEEQLIEAFRLLDLFDRSAVMGLTETLSGRPQRPRRP